MDRSMLLGFVFSACLAIGAFGVSGCENTIDPYSKRGLYALYGYLELDQEQQFVRVRPLRTPLSPESTTVEAAVTLKNLEDGTTTRLRDSIITFTDDNSTVVTHNFFTEKQIQAETKYRLTVEHPSGAQVRATTVTPTDEDATVEPLQGHCETPFKVTFQGAVHPRFIRANLLYWVVRPQDDKLIRVEQDISDSIFRNEKGEIVFLFSPSGFVGGGPPLEDPPDTPECTYKPGCLGLASNHMFLEYTYLGPKWYGKIPEDTLEFDPLTTRDVTNGIGFFGSLRRDRLEIIVDNCHLLPLPPSIDPDNNCPAVDLDTVETAPCDTIRSGLTQAGSLFRAQPPC